MTKKQLFTFAGVAIIVLFVVATLNWIGIQQNTIGGLQTEIFNLRNDLSDTINQELESLKEQLIEELNKQNSNVFNAEYTTTGYSKEDNTAAVTVRFSLKEYTKDSSVQLIYLENNETKSIPATENDGIFESTFSLSLEDTADGPVEYSISYMTGNDVIQSGHVINILPSVDLYDRFDSKGIDTSSVNTGNADIMFYTYFQNRFDLDEKLKFTSCILTIYCDEKILSTVDLTDLLEVSNGYQRLMERGQAHEVNIGNYDLRSVNAEIKAVDGYGFEYTIR